MAQILIHEVGLRDGLQAERKVVTTEQKLDWIRALLDSGLDILQVGSFVRADKVPQMGDTDELFKRLAGEARSCPILLSALVLNEKGLERGMEVGVEMFCMGVSASETHSQKNTGMGTEEAQRRIIAMARLAQDAGKKVQVSVQSAFGCGFEGAISDDRVTRIVGAYLDAGLRNISLADTAGHAFPAQVHQLFGHLFSLDSGIQATCHFHDTFGLGMANVFAAMEAGVTSFETSFAGLGGCPFTKVAAGNVATEDLVHALQREGRRKEIDLDVLIRVAKDVAVFFEREMMGRVHKTGPIKA